MKILIINDFTGKTGGAEIYDHELKNLLEKKGHTVEIIGGKKSYDSLPKHFISTWFNLNYKKKIGRKIKDFNPDVIFAHSIGGNISPSFLVEAKKFGVPVVLKIPNLGQFSFPELSLSKFYRILTWLKKFTHRLLIKKYIDVFIAPSDFMKDFLTKDLGVNNIRTIPNPVFMETQNKNLISIHNKGNKVREILFVGRLDKNKGIDVLITSFKKICSRIDYNVKLTIIGEGKEENRLKELIKEIEIEEQVIFRGYLNFDELKYEYWKSDVFILPSIIEENAPLSPLEAMGQGTPVVTTNIGGQSEIIKDGYNGFLVTPANSEDLADKILKILENDDLRYNMSKNCLEYAKKFSKEKHVKQIERLFQNVIKNGASK